MCPCPVLAWGKSLSIRQMSQTHGVQQMTRANAVMIFVVEGSNQVASTGWNAIKMEKSNQTVRLEVSSSRGANSVCLGLADAKGMNRVLLG